MDCSTGHASIFCLHTFPLRSLKILLLLFSLLNPRLWSNIFSSAWRVHDSCHHGPIAYEYGVVWELRYVGPWLQGAGVLYLQAWKSYLIILQLSKDLLRKLGQVCRWYSWNLSHWLKRTMDISSTDRLWSPKMALNFCISALTSFNWLQSPLVFAEISCFLFWFKVNKIFFNLSIQPTAIFSLFQLEKWVINFWVVFEVASVTTAFTRCSF